MARRETHKEETCHDCGEEIEVNEAAHIDNMILCRGCGEETTYALETDAFERRCR